MKREGVFVIVIGGSHTPQWRQALQLLYELRDAGIPADVDYRQRSLRAQLRAADKANCHQVVIIGEDEWEEGSVVVRDLVTGKQERLPLTVADLANQLN